MPTNNLYNIAFLFLWCIAASSTEVVAERVFCPGQPYENFCDCEGDCTGNPDFCSCDEAKACCAGATPVVLCPDQPKDNYCDCDGDCTNKPEWCQCLDARECCDGNANLDLPVGSVLCSGQPSENYCDCDGDCTEKPEWCQCADAQECCGGDTNSSSDNKLPLPMSSDSIFGEGEFVKNVLCPGQPTENFCDCEGDCTGHPEYCACDEGKACCADATPVVLCPDQSTENYCDCAGDCTEEPQWCQCAEAQKCCNENPLRKKKERSQFVPLIAVTVASFLIGFLLLFFLYNKKARGRGPSLSKAAVSVKSDPRSSSKSDDDATVESVETHHF